MGGSNNNICVDSLKNPSAGPGLMQGTIRRPQELQALTFAPQPRINSGHLPEGPLTGSNVTGVIDGKFEDGYLVTLTIGPEKLKGVLYQLLLENTVAHQMSHGGFSNTWNSSVNPQGVTGFCSILTAFQSDDNRHS